MKSAWMKKRKELLGVGDKLGHGIDKGILDLVTSLNVLGINTTASCEGHTDWGTGGPYVDIASKKVFALRKKLDQARDNEKASELIIRQVEQLNSKEVAKLFPYLNKFYKNRVIPVEQRLVISQWALKEGRLESQGVAWFGKSKKNLNLFQKEMQAFSDLIKQFC